jgi:hypothetical protein
MTITKKQTEEEKKEGDIELAVEAPLENVQMDLLLEREEPSMADPWEKTKTKTLVLLLLPSARRFLFPGMEIRDEQGRFICKLFDEGEHGSGPAGLMFFAIFANAENEPMALVKRNPVSGCGDNHFYINSVSPNYEDQPSSSSFTFNHPGGVSSQIEFTYPRSRLTQSTFGKNYTLYVKKTETMPVEVVLTATNGNIRAMLLFTAMLCSCKGFKLEFYEPGQSHPAILRNQKDDSITVAPGQSPLMGVCLAYAVDRLTAILGTIWRFD